MTVFRLNFVFRKSPYLAHTSIKKRVSSLFLTVIQRMFARIQRKFSAFNRLPDTLPSNNSFVTKIVSGNDFSQTYLNADEALGERLLQLALFMSI